MEQNRKKAIQYLILASILWSMGGLFIKIIDWSPMAIAGARSGIAALVIFVFLRKPTIQITKNKLGGAIAYMFLVILFVSANKLTTSANAILLQFTAPIWAALMSRAVLQERVRRSDWTTIFVVLAGMLLFFVGDVETGHMLGNLLAVLSGVAMSIMIIFLKLQKEGHPVEVTLLGNILTVVVALPFFFLSPLNLGSLLPLMILGVFQLGISYILYTTAVQHVTAVEAILITVIEPLLNPLWVFWVTGESPGIFAFFGGVIVLTAVTGRSIYQAHRPLAPLVPGEAIIQEKKAF